VLAQHIRKQLRHPPLHGVRIAVHQCADTQNGGVPLPDGFVVIGIVALGYMIAPCKANKAVLEMSDVSKETPQVIKVTFKLRILRRGERRRIPESVLE
jgi:hypothetical protein